MIDKELETLIAQNGTGMQREYVPSEDGTTRAIVTQRMGATGMNLRPPIRTPLQQAEPLDMTAGEAAAEIGTATAGMATGAVAGAVGLPGDIASLLYGSYKAAFPGQDEGRAEAFVKGIETVSNAAGSEAALNLINSVIPVESMNPQMRAAYDQAQTAGTFVGLGKAGKAATAGVKQFIADAPARVAAREADTGVTLAAGVDPTPAIDKAIVAMQKRTPPVERDELVNVLRLKADQMRLKPADRIQPSGKDPLFETTPEAYGRLLPEQKETPVPRAPEGAKLPLGDRSRIIVEKTPEIAQKLAERMKPFLGTPAQYFYNTGPLIEKAKSLGVPEDVARQQLKKFALNYAATSPRTKTEPNLRSASIVTAKETRGINYDEVIGPGGDGINEKGYPMIIQHATPGKGVGIHRKLIDDVRAGGINYNTNPKPATFAENIMGNLEGVTVDTHAIRGALDALNEISPGSIPDGFIEKEFRAQYKADPSSFDPATMPIDTLGDQKVNGVKMQTEYAVFSDLYKEAAKILNVPPAEAQALAWFGTGDKTGLASELKTIVELIDDRVDVTAQALNRPKEDVFLDFFSGKIPLMSLGGLTLLETGTMMDTDESEADNGA